MTTKRIQEGGLLLLDSLDLLYMPVNIDRRGTKKEDEE